MNGAPRPWRHTFLPLDTAPERVNPGNEVVALWQGRRGASRLPAWSMFDMFDFKPWLGSVSVDRVTRDPFDTTVRLWGTKLRELYGFDATGWGLRRDYARRGLTTDDFEFWRKVVSDPCIGIGQGSVDWQGRDFVRVTRVFLPLAEDGNVVDHVLAVAFQDEPER